MKTYPQIDQRSPEWWALRCGKPTASEFSSLVTSKGEPSKSLAGYAMTLAIEKYAGKPVDAWEGNAHTDRGRELEARALELYEFTRDVEVTPVGFVTTDDGITGCSPDGLIGGEGMLEIKCLKGENHGEAIVYFQKHGRCQPKYIQQTQGQLMIAERKWCDLLFYHPELPALVIRQHPIRELHAALRLGIRDVIAERDEVLAILQSQGKARPAATAAAPLSARVRPPVPAVDLSQAEPVF